MMRTSGAKRALFGIAAACGALLMGASAQAQGVNCDNADLQHLVDTYLDTQQTGDTLKLPLANFAQYTEQMEEASIQSDMLSKPLKIDLHRSFLDLATCSAYVELIVTDPAHPYVIGTRLQFSGRFNPIAASRLNGLDSVITDKGDWLFNASKTLAYAKGENWGEIPAADRDSRDVLMAAANAYLDSFDKKGVVVPWGTPCARLEGGLYTGDRCDVGIPSGIKMAERQYVVDDTHGMVAVFLQMGPNKRPDVHSFRIEKGKIRYIHTMTVCTTVNCGQTVPDDVQKKLLD
jgi:hypothetical protein